jgi:hypothetical protein
LSFQQENVTDTESPAHSLEKSGPQVLELVQPGSTVFKTETQLEIDSNTQVQSVKVVESCGDGNTNVSKISEVVVQTSTLIDEPFHKVVEEITKTR